MSLAILGLTAEQERLYRYLLRSVRTDVDTAGAELAMPNVRSVAAQLRALGLVDDTLTATSPEVAVDLLVRRRLEQTRRRLGELTLAWDVLTELAEEHRSGRTVQMVEHIPDGTAVVQRILRLLTDEPGELLHLRERVLLATTESTTAPFTGLLARGLRSRTLVALRALETPEQEAHARRWHAVGDLHRVTTEPVRQLALVNRTVAFVQADPADPRAGALQIRQSGLVAILVDLFDGMWSRARDLDDPSPSPIERMVLHALTRHDTDDAAARSLNISVRKFRAHVADLMSRVGATTRFQAGLLAKERGWL
ncbi:helix-turn-helix domain-containing protein [Saccharothrix variisporea]|uniref:hypothetical protein n=1 Tax=Saccharothrix variisporea TaxID=543527 RepID=UPI000EB563B5|nr:hypothetical protein [Saccharothrix variisporea]